MRFFDKIYVLNCDHRPDRMERISHRLNQLRLSFERIPAVVMTEEQERNRKFKSANIYANACTFYNTYKKFLHAGARNALILEDDAVFRDDLLEQVDKIINQLDTIQWDMVYLGLDLHPNDKPQQQTANLYSFGKGYHFHAVAVNSTFINKLIEITESLLKGNYGSYLDCYINEFRTIRKFLTKPLLAVQEAGYSDITKEPLNRLPQYFKYFDRQEFYDNCKEMRDNGW